MNEKPDYYLVDRAVLPEIFKRVIEAKKLLASSKVKTINEATNKVGISRSAFYKYKDSVFFFHEKSKDKIITLSFIVLDILGVLSDIINVLAKKGADILTINQNIPINGIANVTISFRTGNLKCNAVELIDKLLKNEGINKIEIIASE